MEWLVEDTRCRAWPGTLRKCQQVMTASSLSFDVARTRLESCNLSMSLSLWGPIILIIKLHGWADAASGPSGSMRLNSSALCPRGKVDLCCLVSLLATQTCFLSFEGLELPCLPCPPSPSPHLEVW